MQCVAREGPSLNGRTIVPDGIEKRDRLSLKMEEQSNFYGTASVSVFLRFNGTRTLLCGSAHMAFDDKERAKLLKHIGEVLRADRKGFHDEVPSRPILLQVLHLIRREQARKTGNEAIAWEDLPDDLRQLLERLKAGERG
jgi:hypothetical protein